MIIYYILRAVLLDTTPFAIVSHQRRSVLLRRPDPAALRRCGERFRRGTRRKRPCMCAASNRASRCSRCWTSSSLGKGSFTKSSERPVNHGAMVEQVTWRSVWVFQVFFCEDEDGVRGGIGKNMGN